MSMTQRYAGMLRRQAGEWDKQGMPVQAECCRQAARHMETRELELKHALTVTGETLDTECDDGDALLRILDLEPAQYRTEEGRLNLLKIRAALADRKTPNAGVQRRPAHDERDPQDGLGPSAGTTGSASL